MADNLGLQHRIILARNFNTLIFLGEEFVIHYNSASSFLACDKREVFGFARDCIRLTT